MSQEIPALVDAVVEHRADIFAFARYCPSQRRTGTPRMLPAGIPEALLEALLGEVPGTTRPPGARPPSTRKDHLWTLFHYEKGLFRIPEDRAGRT